MSLLENNLSIFIIENTNNIINENLYNNTNKILTLL